MTSMMDQMTEMVDSSREMNVSVLRLPLEMVESFFEEIRYLIIQTKCLLS